MKKIFQLFLVFLIWRIVLLIPLAISPLFLPENHASGITNLWSFTRPYAPVDSTLLYPWANFDGIHYLTLSWDGYTYDAEGRFFPLYPMIIHGVTYVLHTTTVFGLVHFFSALFVANICFFLSLIFLYKLLRIDFSEKITWTMLAAVLIFPASFFYGAIYSESLFLFFSVASFYFARKQQWIGAGIMGMLVSATRIVGIAMFPALLFELYQAIKEKKAEKKNIVPLLLIPLGLLSFLIFSFYRWHDPLYFIHSQVAVGGGRSGTFVIPFQALFRYGKILFGGLSFHQYEWWIALFELSSCFFASVSLYFLWKWKVRSSYIIFALVSFLVPISTGTFSGLPRYVSALFPLFIVIGLIKNTWLKVFYFVICSIALFLLLLFFSRGYFVA